MIPGRPSPHRHEARISVAEQPGLTWSFLAIMLALFFGLAFRSTFSSEKISVLIQAAAKNIHPDLKVSFESAYLSLSDGLFPELAVVVENIDLSSANECWMQPKIKVDELRLPLELTELLRGRVRLATVDVGHVEVLFRSNYKSCARQPASESKPEVDSKSDSQSPATSRNLDVQVTRTHPVENVFIRSLHMEFSNNPSLQFEFNRWRIKTDAEQKHFESEGSFWLPLENSKGSSPRAELRLDFQSDTNLLNVEMNGFWREGRFSLQSQTDLKTQKTNALVDADHLPLTQVLGLLEKQGLVQQEFNGRQAWVSAKLKTDGEQILNGQAHLKIEELKIEGDLGELEGKDIFLTNLSPMKAEPFTLSLNGVRLEKLFSFFDLAPPSPVLGDLGTFNGELKYQNFEEFGLAGEHSGLQFVFSNLGQREMQTMSLISGRAFFKKNHWEVDLDRIRPLEGLFLGRVKIRADKQWRSVNLNLDVDELSLSPAVQKLMSDGGSLGRIAGKVELDLESGKLENIHGQLSSSNLNIDNLSIGHAQAQLNTLESVFKLDVQAKKIELNRPSPLLETLSPFLPAQEKLASDQLHFSISSKDLKELRWKLFPVRMSSVVLKSEGSWSKENRLSGELIRTEGSQERKWLIKGTREQPLFEPE